MFLFLFQIDPAKWTVQQVSQWLDWAVKEFSLDTVDRTHFQMSGSQLCELNKEDFVQRAPAYTGDVLHSHLSLLRAKNCKLLNIIDTFL